MIDTPLASINFSEYSEQLQARVNASLAEFLGPAETRLLEAMHYVVFNGGKRLRPLLVYATGEALGTELDQLDAPACSVELIHAYSLVHDDLPAMDDDELRRGKPTCHIAYDDATAILAGDALHSLAIESLSGDKKNHQDAKTRIQMLSTLASASGAKGMAGGQMLDLEAVDHSLTALELEQMYQLKTGALITASVQISAIAAQNCNASEFTALSAFANSIGFAFQIHDDILDLEVNTEKLGKPQYSDLRQHKATYPLLLGIPAAKQKVDALYQEAIAHLSGFNQNAKWLREVAKYMVSRDF